MQYSNVDVNQHILNNPENTQLKANFVETAESLHNSYRNIVYWAKGEASDLEAFQTAIDLRNAGSKKAIELKKKNTST